MQPMTPANNNNNFYTFQLTYLSSGGSELCAIRRARRSHARIRVRDDRRAGAMGLAADQHARTAHRAHRPGQRAALGHWQPARSLSAASRAERGHCHSVPAVHSQWHRREWQCRPRRPEVAAIMRMITRPSARPPRPARPRRRRRPRRPLSALRRLHRSSHPPRSSQPHRRLR